MRTSDTINELAAALAKAQAEIKNAAFNRTNPHFKSKYADLASVRDAVTPALTKNGIAVVQMTGEADGKMIVSTRLIHASGQWIESAYPIINDTNKPQAMGSALSYARRYSLSAICNIASEEDDDANEAQSHGKTNGNGGEFSSNPDAKHYKSNGTTAKAVEARANNEFYTACQTEIRNAQSIEALKEWRKLRDPEMKQKLSPQAAELLYNEVYLPHRESLEARGP